MAQCKRCNAYIDWVNTTSGWKPINNDGSSHFETCLVPSYKIDRNLEKRISEEKNKTIEEPIQIGEDEFL